MAFMEVGYSFRYQSIEFSPILPTFDDHRQKVRYMTWKEAIRKVLLDEGGPLHYTDITTRIFENGYKGKSDSGQPRNRLYALSSPRRRRSSGSLAAECMNSSILQQMFLLYLSPSQKRSRLRKKLHRSKGTISSRTLECSGAEPM